MALELGTINAKAVLDATGITRGVNQAIQEIQRLGGVMSQIGTVAQQQTATVVAASQRQAESAKALSRTQEAELNKRAMLETRYYAQLDRDAKADAAARMRQINQEVIDQQKLSRAYESEMNKRASLENRYWKQVDADAKKAAAEEAKALRGNDVSGLKSFYMMERLGGMARMYGQELARMGDVGVRALAGLVTTGAEFNRHLIEIQNNTGITDKQFQSLRDTVQTIGTSVGGNMNKIADGTMHAVNLFRDMDKARSIATAGAKAAIATGGDEEKTINGLAKSMKEWNIPAYLANQTMNGLLVSAQRANTTLPQMMDHTDRIRAAFANLNLSLPDTLALFATLTQHGLSASQAETQLLNMTNRLLKPTAEMSKTIDFITSKVDKDFKQAFTVDAVQRDGWPALFERINRDAIALHRPVSQLAVELFPGLRGTLAGLVFTGTGITDLRKNVELFQGTFGRQTELDMAVARSKRQLSVQMEQLGNQIAVVGSKLAQSLAPAIQTVIDYVKAAVDWFSKLDTPTRNWIVGLGALTLILASVGGRIVAFAGTLVQVRAAMIAIQEARAAAAIANVGTAAAAANVSVGGLAISIAAVAASLFALLALKNRIDAELKAKPSDDRKAQQDEHAEMLRRNPGVFGDWNAGGFEDIKQRLRPMPINLDSIATRNLKELSEIQMALDTGVDSQQNALSTATMMKLAADRDKKLGWLKANKFALPQQYQPMLGMESVKDMAKKYTEEQKKAAADAKKAAREAATQARQDARELERQTEDTARAVEDLNEKIFKAMNPDIITEKRHDLNVEMAELKRRKVPLGLQRQYYGLQTGNIDREATANATETPEAYARRVRGEIGSEFRDMIMTIDVNMQAAEAEARARMMKFVASLPTNLSSAMSAGMAKLGEMMTKFTNANMFKTRGLGPVDDTQVAKDIATLGATPSADLLSQYTRLYRFQYEQDNIAGENYLRFLNYKLSLTSRYSEEWMVIQKEMQRVEEDLNKSSTEVVKKQVKEKNTIFRELMKGIQRDFTNILANLFDNLLSGAKNPFKAFFDAFKQMLIRMAAELAASKLMQLISGLFGKKGGPAGGGGGQKFGGELGAGIGTAFGGPIGGAIGGAIGGMLGFADGGWVPGPVGAPRAAVVHGGELVLNPQQLSTLGGITITGDMHFHGVRDVGTFQRQLGDYLDKIGRTRQGSG